jgi:hypothetical protein
MSDTVTTEDALRFCINEQAGKVNVIRVELTGVAKFACWWFVIDSTLATVAVLFYWLVATH